MNINELIYLNGIIPVIKINDVADAVPLAKAIVKGGMNTCEITFRTEAAKDSIKAISDAIPSMIVGAGTVLTVEQVDEAVGAGARFIVSPGLNPTVVKYCVDKNIPIFPGCTSPSDIEVAIELGLDVVKFFPAEQAGGLEFIKAVAAPYTKMKFMPTGGINEKNIGEYLAYEKIIACGGSFMVKEDLIKSKNFDKISELCAEAINKMLGFELAHIGVNANSEEEATNGANRLFDIFSFKQKKGAGGTFAGTAVELLNTPYLGKQGHIAIKTNNIERAIYFLENKGVKFNCDSKKYNANGKFIAIYLEEEIAGFAYHLLQKS